MMKTDSFNAADRRVRLLEIERFAIHDGPGIRTVVFLQGCPLHCQWCANPESQAVGNHLLHNDRKCVRCGRCVKACPKGYISFKDGRIAFDRRDCAENCSVCKDACPQNAINIAGTDMSVNEVMNVVLRDKDYYEHSGGGVTFSGGEAIAQIDILLLLLQACREENVHTAVETCGQVPESYVRRILPYVDLFLFDIKHTDALKLKSATGGNLDTILGNLSCIARNDPKKVIIRVPCIQGFNLSDDFFDSVFSLAQKLGVERVDLLPYHTLGLHKYAQMGIKPPFSEESSLPSESLEVYKQKGEKRGLTICLNG